MVIPIDMAALTTMEDTADGVMERMGMVVDIMVAGAFAEAALVGADFTAAAALVEDARISSDIQRGGFRHDYQ